MRALIWVGLLVILGSIFGVGLLAGELIAQVGHQQTAPLVYFGANEPVPNPPPRGIVFRDHPAKGQPAGGSVTLTRTESSLSYVIDAASLLPKHAYTVWWWIDDPEEPGNDAALAGPAEVLVNGGGGVSDEDGGLTLSGTLFVGDYVDVASGPQAIVPGSFARPLQVAVTIYIKDHGIAADVADLVASITRADSAECPCFDPVRAKFAAPPGALPSSGSGGIADDRVGGPPQAAVLGLSAAALGVLAAVGFRASSRGK